MTISKKLISTSAMLFIACQVNAGGLVPEDDEPTEPIMEDDSGFKTGVYGGFNVGYDNLRFRATSSSDILAVAPAAGSAGNLLVQTLKASKGGFTGGLVLGSHYVTDGGFATGFEIGGYFNSAKPSKTETIPAAAPAGIVPLTATHRLTHRFTITPSLMLGYAVGSFMPYANLGMPISRMKYTVTTAGQFTPLSLSKSKFTFGLEPGLGLKYAITPQLLANINGSYAFHFGKLSVAAPLVVGIPFAANGSIAATADQIRGFTIKAGLSYGLTF